MKNLFELAKTKLKTLVTIIVATCLINFNPIENSTPFIASAMTNTEITDALTNLQSKYPNNSYWIPPTEQKYGGWQCYAFARQLAVDIFGSYPSVNVVYASEGQISNGWRAVKTAANVTLEPGDIIRADNNAHSAMIWKIEGEYVYVAQCWGNSNDKINWGPFYGNHKKEKISNLLDSGFSGVWKHPDSPDPEQEETYVNITGETLPSSPHTYGKPFEIAGIITSNKKITSVHGGVYHYDDWSPVENAYGEFSVNAYSYNLGGAFNLKIIFNTLPDNARYHYLVCVRTEDGKEFHPIDWDFYVGNPDPVEHVHSLEVKTSVEPTCTEPGYTIRECTCGYEETEYTDSKGHQFSDWETDVAATCEEVGMAKRYCLCGKVEKKEIAPVGHSYFETSIPAECTVNGKIVKICQLCNNRLETVIEKTGHVFGESITVDNKIIKRCIRPGCDYQETVMSASEPMTGDVNLDGKIDITDLTLLSLNLLGDNELTEEQLISADVDSDGELKLTDLAKLRQFVSKIIVTL